MAYTKNITVDQGTTFIEDFIISTGVDAVLDLTGFVARMQVRDTSDTTTTRLNLNTENGKLLIVPLSGKVSIRLAPPDTSSIKFTGDKLKCVYDLEIEDSAGTVTRVVQGSITFVREITR